MRIQANGNSKTRLMHSFTFKEIKNCYSNPSFCFLKPEQGVILEPLREKGIERKGSFDFLLETSNHELIGFEVLTRPSKGKLKRKLSYAKEVEKYVFVIPSGSFEFYKRKEKRPFEKISQEHCFPKEFNSEKLQVWLFDFWAKKFSQKGQFSKIFNVEN